MITAWFEMFFGQSLGDGILFSLFLAYVVTLVFVGAKILEESVR